LFIVRFERHTVIVFDGHNDTLTHLRREENDPVQAFIHGTDKGHLDLPRARSRKLVGTFFAIFTPPPLDSPERDSMHGLEFTNDGYIVSERSPVDSDYARRFTDEIITQARQIEASAVFGKPTKSKSSAVLNRCGRGVYSGNDRH